MEQTQTTVSVTDMVRKIAKYDGWKPTGRISPLGYEFLEHADYGTKTINVFMTSFEYSYHLNMHNIHPMAIRVYHELTKAEDTELKNGANPEKWDSIMLCIHAIKDALLQPIMTGELLKAVYDGICLLEKYNTPA